MLRRLLLLTLAALLLAAPAAQAGALIDRAVAGLQDDNVYVDPDADPTLTPEQAEALRDRISSAGAAPLYVVVAPKGIRGEAGGDAGLALREIGQQLQKPGTYVIVAGRRIEAASTAFRAGRAGELVSQAIEGSGGDVDTILTRFTDLVAAEDAGGGGSEEDEGSSATGIAIVGAVALGGGGLLLLRRRRRHAREAAEFAQAKRNARDDLVALGDDIRALDLDASMPTADPQAKADYDQAVTRYTEAEEQWEAARAPRDLAPVGAALEEGRWAMASAQARFAGETPPERRPPCFFDPRHGPSARDVLWSPPYGREREVPACEADAQRVERGEDPRAREVVWSGRRVPYWQAGPAYAPYAGGFYGGGVLPGLLVGSALGGAWSPGPAWADASPDGGGGFGGGDFGGGDFGGGDFGGGDFGGGGFGGGGDF